MVTPHPSRLVPCHLPPRGKAFLLRGRGEAPGIGVGQEAGAHEGIHVAGIGGKLQIGHIGGKLRALFLRGSADGHGVSARQGRVADILELLQFHIREHADADGVAHIDAAADAAGHIHGLDGFHGHIHGGQHGVDGGIDRALGTDEVIDIHLVDGNFPSGLGFILKGDDIAAHTILVTADTAALPDKEATGVDDPGAEQLRDDIDDAAAADAHYLLAGFAHYGEGRLHGGFIDGAGFYSAVGSAHTAGNVAAFKGRACAAGAAHEKIAVAEDQLAVGTQVDKEAHFFFIPERGRQGAGSDIAADIRADIGGDDDFRQRVGGELQITGLEAVPGKEAGYVRLHTDGIGVHAQEQMVHGGIRADAQPQNGGTIDTGGLAQICDDGIQGFLQNGVLELFPAPGAGGFNDTVDNIRAVADLAVAGRTLGQQLAGGQIAQHHGDGGGADINGAADDGGVIGGGDVHAGEGVILQFALDADREVVGPQHMGKLCHNGVGDDHLFSAGFCLDRPGKALVIGHGIIQSRLSHSDHHSPAAVGKFNARGLQIFLAGGEDGDLLGRREVGGLHAGLVSRCNIGNQDGDIADDLAVAAEAPALGIFFFRNMARRNGFQFAV